MTTRIDRRSEEIFEGLHREVCVETDRLFAVLMGVQWLLGVAVAFTLSPWASAGASGATHFHLWAAIGLGGVIAALSILLALCQPGQASTRHAIAVGQMLFGALLIYLSGGRIETHFHIFGSLALLAFYRDWRVLVSATLVAILDHAIRGLLFPQSIYGVLTPDGWRFLEHAGWVTLASIVLVTGCVRGIRELRRMAGRSAELEASEDRYTAVVGQSADGMLLFDAGTLNVLEFNSAFERRAGATPGQLSGITLDKRLVGGDPSISIADEVSRLLENGRPTLTDRVLRTLDGNRVEVSCSMSPTTYAGRPAVCAVIRDVGARNRVQAELTQAHDAAITLARLTSQFLTNMSHEIRTPMNGVIGMTSLLLGTPISPHQRELTETIQSSTESLLAVIDDILDFSKIESGKMELETVEFDLRQLLETIVDQFAERAFAKGIELVPAVGPEVPSGLKGDSRRLRQVLVNLIGNAVKFTTKGEVAIAVSAVTATAGEACVRFEIRDSGIGIPEEARARVFSAFSPADGSTTRQSGGNGLGLAISRRLVALFRGEMGFETVVGEGTTFWFTVRCAMPKSMAPPVAVAAEWAGKRVLVVDDSDCLRESLAASLTAWGLEGLSAHGAPNALAALGDGAADGRPFAAAIIDRNMPGVDGLQLARMIRADSTLAGVAIILMTPFGTSEDSAANRAEGIAASLAKPLKDTRVREVLDRVLAPSRAVPIPREEPVAKTPPPIRACVLVAEDNAVNQRVALLQLQRLGCSADGVQNGAEAVAALRNKHYDLVLMDCQMPELDGYDATRQIRQLEGSCRDVPIIALTAHALNGDREKCLAAGMSDYLSKPLKLADLQASLERWLVDRRACA